MKRRCVLEEAVGETRAAVYEGRKLVELYTRRWSEANLARRGDIYNGNVKAIDPTVDGAFVDIGDAGDAFLKFSNAHNAPRLTEGQSIQVEIYREAEDGKLPIVRFRETGVKLPVGRVSGDDLAGYVANRFPGITFENAPVSVIDDATDIELAINGGGSIAIERTRALIAIDVDKGTANSGFDVCMTAVPLIAQQLRLRGLGGLIVIDFPNLRQPRQRNAVMRALEEVFENDPNGVKLAPLSRFGCVELTRAKPGPSLDEVLNERNGLPRLETLALQAVRRLEREGRSNPGARMVLTVTGPIKSWLDNNAAIEAELAERLGQRFSIVIGPKVDVEIDR